MVCKFARKFCPLLPLYFYVLALTFLPRFHLLILLLNFPILLLNFPTVILYFLSLLLYFHTLLLYFPTLFLHIPTLILRFPAVLLSGASLLPDTNSLLPFIPHFYSFCVSLHDFFLPLRYFTASQGNFPTSSNAILPCFLYFTFYYFSLLYMRQNNCPAQCMLLSDSSNNSTLIVEQFR